MPDWTFEVLDYAGVAKGEILNAHERVVAHSLNGPSTASFRIALDHPFANELIEGDRLIRAKRNGVTNFVGPVVSAEEGAAGEGGVIGVVCLDPFFDRLSARMIGKSIAADGKGVGYAQGTALLPVVRGQIAKSIIDVTNAADGFTGVQTDNAWITDTGTSFVGPWYYKPITEAVVEMAATLDGYDFEVRMVDPVAIGAGLKLAEFRTYNARGQARPTTIFEYGTGKANMRGYKRPRTRDGQINRAYSLPQGFPDSSMAIVQPDADGNGGVYQAPVANNFDASASITKWGLREAVVNSDLAVDDFRQKLCNEHVRIRRNPREQITFDLAANIEYDYGTHYAVGDTFPARAKVAGVTRFDAMFRCYAVSFGISDEGDEQVSLTVIPT
jgi:hypothetical protein